MKIDFHMHTNFSPDSTASPHAMIGRAIELGLESICITDHYEMEMIDGKMQWTIDRDRYVDALLDLKEMYRDEIKVGVGVEFGLDTRYKHMYKEMAQGYPLDFIIGSNHKTPGSLDIWSNDKPDSYSDQQWYTDALTMTHEMVKEIKDFDVLGHVDYIVRYGRYQAREYRVSDYYDILTEVFKTIIYDGKGIEVNAAGFKYGLGFAHPHVDIMKLYRELGGEIITVGSDAHSPEHIGYNYKGVRQQLLQVGFKFYTEFSNRKPIFRELV